MVREAGEEMLEIEGFHFSGGLRKEEVVMSLVGLAIVEL